MSEKKGFLNDLPKGYQKQETISPQVLILFSVDFLESMKIFTKNWKKF